MYILHIANKNYSSWSLRPWVLMKTLGIPFEEKLEVFTGPGVQPQFRTFSPSGKVPCLIDGDMAIWETISIIEYLGEQFTGVWPADGRARAYARSASAEMHAGFSTLRNRCSMNVGIRVTLRDRPPELQHDIARIASLWADGITQFGGPFLAGEVFTAVDAMYAPIAFRAQTYGILDDAVSATYIERMLALPAMQAWQDAALNEPWREPGHEAEAASTGTTTADFRVG